MSDKKPHITTDEAAACLTLLESAAGPMTAAEIAARLNLAGCRESQRRHVRALVKHLRDTDVWIAATLSDGYFLTKDPDVWAKHNVDKQIGAKKVISQAYRREKCCLRDRLGQGLLFNPNPRVCV
ncbi:MAG: hypothetical protein DRP65_00560 [Planctomycetota bacterium]|nr:MAG: hypothetical protein DRP65_00560 [Planctomycetota bacterium]